MLYFICLQFYLILIEICLLNSKLDISEVTDSMETDDLNETTESNLDKEEDSDSDDQESEEEDSGEEESEEEEDLDTSVVKRTKKKQFAARRFQVAK